MKLLLRLTGIAVIIISFSSCIKTYETPAPVTDPIVGTWYLYDASESYGNGWYPFDAQLDGTLTFYSNGAAEYNDGYVYLQGSWYTQSIRDGYYDEWGNYYTGYHDNFQTSLSGNGNSSLNLYFDDLSFNGNNQFTGTYYNSKSIERYTFRRY